MKKITSFFVFILFSMTLTFNTALGSSIGTGSAEVEVLGGDLAIVSYPATLSFNDYQIGLNNASSNLATNFTLLIEDFSGTHAGWNLIMNVSPLMAGTVALDSPALTSDFTNTTIFNSDETGAQNVSNPLPFTTYGGTINFSEDKKIISAALDNAGTAGRNHFNFATDSLNLYFSNLTKTGNYTGTTTFTLVTGP